MAAQRIFAVDFGASGGKCFAGTFEAGAFAMQEIHRFPHEGVTFYLPDQTGQVVERAYWDDIWLYRHIVEGLQAFRRDVSNQVDGIGIDTWGADGHFMNADGEMLGRIYCYRDHRLDDMIEQVKARIDARRIYEITGVHFQPFNLSNQLLWFITHRADLLRPGCFFLPIPSVFYYALGGGRQVDSSWASITQLMDARARTWSDEILTALGIPRSLLPDIVEPGAIVGQLHAKLAAAIGINRPRLVAAAAHDTASAFAAAPVDQPGEALIISSGTWSLVGALIPQPITTPEARRHNFSNEGGIGNIRFLKNCMGGWLAQELRRVWRTADGQEMSWKEMDAQTLAAPAFTAFVDPDDAGFYNPSNMQEAIDAFCRRTGQPVPATRGAYLRLVYESLALKYRLVNEQICEVSGKPTRAIHIVGGGCRNVMLNQFTADACGLPVIAGPSEATAVGNIMVQAVAMGVIPTLHDAMPLIRATFPIAEYKPQATAAWDKAYERFRALVAKPA